MTNPYVDALAKIPKGETRSFAEIAALAGRPSGARAAGRAVTSCPSESKAPWHRAVNTAGAFSIDPGRAALQLVRLRADGARPKDGESVSKWARRVRAAFVGTWKVRGFVAADDERTASFAPERVERFASADEALARGFRPIAEKKAAPGRARSGTGSTVRELRVRESRAPVANGANGANDANETDDEELAVPTSIDERISTLDWKGARERLADEGVFVAPALLATQECARMRKSFASDEPFERTIEMAPRGYGIGRYRYFREPLPSPAFELRERLYRELRSIAVEVPGAVEYPRTLAAFFERCRRSGQGRGSSILLAYPRGGVNHPHRDIYGAQWFPYQALIVLSRRGREFEGGDFQLHEKAADGSTRVRAFPLDQGDLCVFASRSYRAQRRDSAVLDGRGRKQRWIEIEHGMSVVTRGERLALGIVLHLAE